MRCERAGGGRAMQFLDAVKHKQKLVTAQMPETWSRVEIRCPACGRIFVAYVSPREDTREGWQAARRSLIRSCPDHASAFRV